MKKILNNFTLEVTLTQKCDMACTYCFEGDELQNKKKQHHTDNIIKTIEGMLLDKKFMNIYDGININLWGGEPSLNTKMVLQLFNEFKSDDRISFFMYTNGFNRQNIETILKQSIQLENYNNNEQRRLSYQISYDGLIHDKCRIDHNDKGTAKTILENIDYFYKNYQDVRFSLKSTIVAPDMIDMVDNWLHFKELQLKYPIMNLMWAPTVEYSGVYDIDKELLETIRTQFLMIGKLELEHFKKYKTNVLTWFNELRPALCSAGVNIANIDLDGDLSICHGALYLTKPEDKKDLFYSNINNNDCIEQLLTNHYKHQEILDNNVRKKDGVQIGHCEGCVATVCFQCPTVQYSMSKLNEYSQKLHDPKIDLCDIYKEFGKISRTLRPKFVISDNDLKQQGD